MKWKEFLTPVKSLEAGEAKALIEKSNEGSFTLLDVRQPGEYEKERIAGAQLIPLPELYGRYQEIDPENPVITYCAIGGRSRVAAQFLAGQGFKEVYNLKGGIAAWKGLKISGPAEEVLVYITGDEAPEDVVALAYNLEQGMGEFYSAMASQATDSEVKDTFIRLAGFEERHQQQLLEHYRTLEPSFKGSKIEMEGMGRAMEGGFSPDDFIRQNQPLLKTVPNIISLAMMIEARSLDLYLRYSQRSKHPETKRVMLRLGDDEKAHLAKLGSLIEEKF